MDTRFVRPDGIPLVVNTHGWTQGLSGQTAFRWSSIPTDGHKVCQARRHSAGRQYPRMDTRFVRPDGIPLVVNTHGWTQGLSGQTAFRWSSIPTDGHKVCQARRHSAGRQYSAFRNFFPKFCLILKEWFLTRFPPNFQERFLMSSASPEFVFWDPKIKQFCFKQV